MEPIRYVMPVWRPPSEAHSLIVPLTDGCSWNRCTFCDMYSAPQKRFRPRDQSEVLKGIEAVGGRLGERVQRVFLGDGDAMVLSTRRLRDVLAAIRAHLPAVRRVSAYCLARNLRGKSVGELGDLREAGLRMVYLGAESGDDETLAGFDKGETFDSTAEALGKLGEAGIARSVMILNGMGGVGRSAAHADASARLINLTQPEYLSTLVLTLPPGEARVRARWPDWQALTVSGLLMEQRRFVAALTLARTVFRSDHASNWLSLRGTLGADKARLLRMLDAALADDSGAALRPAHARGL